MTPELKAACELVFQEHKSSSYPVTWNRDAFRGRLSTGLTEMAKDTLIRKKIIQFPHPSKRILTILNSAVTNATSFEEAERLLANPVAVGPAGELTASMKKAPSKKNAGIYVSRTVSHPPVVRLAAATQAQVTQSPVAQYMEVVATRWYLKPVFVYGIWPVCAAIAGGCIAYLMGTVYTELVFDLKN